MGQVFPPRVGRFLGWLLMGLCLISGLSIWNPIALSQIPSLPRSTTTQLPNGVTRQGLLEVTGVKLGGKEVLKIASPAVFNRNDLGNSIPVEVRANQIEANLNQLLKPERSLGFDTSEEEAIFLDPDTVQVFIETLNRQPLLFIKGAGLAEPRVLLTVIDTDAQYHATTKEILSARWQKILERELRLALELRKPGALNKQINDAVKILIAMIVLNIFLLMILKVLKWQKNNIEKYKSIQEAASLSNDEMLSNEIASEHRPPLLEVIRQQLNSQRALQRRLQILELLQWLSFWAIVFVWVAGIAATLHQFPRTRPFTLGVVSTPIVILIVWFITDLINRLINLGIELFIKAWEHSTLTVENSKRRSQRLTTAINALKGMITALIYSLGVIHILQFLNIGTAPLLAFSTLIGLAISLGVQSVVKDLVNGLLILIEDQYAVGDYVVIGSASGIVENVNLRVTQVRADDGRLVTLPNSLIAQVDNLTRTWSRSDFMVDVPYDTNIDKALEILQEEANQLARDPAWQLFILDVGELLGVEKMSPAGITLRIWIKTLPFKQFIVARELRRRLKITFDLHGIHIGPSQTVSKPEPTGSVPDPTDDCTHNHSPPQTSQRNAP